MLNEELRKELQELLLNDSDLMSYAVTELNSLNGCFDGIEWYSNDDDFFDDFLAGYSRSDIAKMIFYGDYNYNHKYVKFDGYGNLTSTDYTDYEDYIEEIIDNLIEERYNLDLDPEISEVFEKYDDMEEEEEEE